MAAASAAETRPRGRGARGKAPRTFEDLDVGQCLGVRGGCSPEWTAVPTVTHAGKEVFSVAARTTWLGLHAFGAACLAESSQRAAFIAFAAWLRDAACAAACPAPPGEAAAAAPATPRQAPLRGAGKLGVVLSDPPTPTRKTGRGRARGRGRAGVRTVRRALNAGFFGVELGGVTLSVKKKPGPGVFVEAHPDAVAAVVRGLRASWEEGQQKVRAKRPRELEASPAASDEDGGRLRWCFSRRGWLIRYQDAAGETHLCMKGLRVPVKSGDGTRLSDEEYQENRAMYQTRARALWNELDMSGSERFDINPVEAMAAGVQVAGLWEQS